MSDFIGSGWSFPVRTDATASIATNGGDERIRQSIRIILGTARGERPMRPEFGCGIHELVFEVLDARLADRVEREVRAALVRWEPRITVKRVVALRDPDDAARVLVDISYVVRRTDDARNLVYPFYAVGGDAR
jgi:phage baseplate assembly protein W